MIQYGNSSVTDVKYGSQQIAKVCQGADVIWEKNGWTELHIGDDFVISTFTDTRAKSDGGDKIQNNVYNPAGFYFLQNPFGNTVLNAFDGNPATYCEVSNSDYAYTSSNHLMMQFPFEVILQSVTIVDETAAKSAKQGTIYYSVNEEGSAFGTGTGRDVFASFSGRTGGTPSTYTNDDLAETLIRSVDLKVLYWQAAGSHRVAEWKMTVLVRTSDYVAWKRQYAAKLAGATIV